MKKGLDWLTKPPFYRLLLLALVLFFTIAIAEGQAYWVGGFAVVLYLFLLGYAKFIRNL